MLGASGLMATSGDGEADGGASGGSSEAGVASSSVPGGVMEESGGGGVGNRWPRQETLALLKIRSDMDLTFRDSSLKGPLWEEVSRKMAELGYQRSGKKCKEKFENVYKYHKRTKDGRASKSDGKTYRFFDQLRALENTPPPHFNPPPPRLPAVPVAMAPEPHPMPTNVNTSSPMPPPPHIVTVSSTPSPNPLSIAPPAHISNNRIISSSSSSFQYAEPPFRSPPPPPTSNAPPPPQIHTSQAHFPASFLSNSPSTSSTSSDENIERRRGRKRKWKDFFEQLMNDVIHKQEDLQQKFLEALEKRERERTAREEAWRVQEMARMNREHELLVQERSIAAAKDAAVIAFLQKVTDQHSDQIPIGNNNAAPRPMPRQVPTQTTPPENTQPPPLPPSILPPAPPPPPKSIASPPVLTVGTPIKITTDASKTDNSSGGGDNSLSASSSRWPKILLSAPPPPPKSIASPPVLTVGTPIKITTDASKTDNSSGGGDNSLSGSSSRWPKSEIEALINLRTNLDLKYQDNGPKGPLWEEISSAMAKLGYNRSSKRCKEKWENINKYFKKVKESNKKRPEDSKTCPYFHQLDALYKDKARNDVAPSYHPNPDTPVAPIMARPEQQWPLPSPTDRQQQQPHDSAMPGQQDHNNDRENNDHEDDDDDDDQDDGGVFEIVANKQTSSVTNAAD